MNLLYNLPLFALFTLVLTTCIAVGLSGVWLVRYKKCMLSTEDNNTASLIHAFIGVLYAVALGLMVVGVQSGYEKVELAVMKEANLAGDLYFDAEGLAEHDKKEIQILARQYIESVIDTEWPVLSPENFMHNDTQEIIDKLAKYIITLQPKPNHETVVFAEILNGVNELLDQRRERLHLGSDGVGTVTWLVITMGALITIGMTWFYNTQSARAHYLLVSMMSLMFGLMIFLVIAMDHPLWGGFSVSSSPYEEVLEDIEHR